MVTPVVREAVKNPEAPCRDLDPAIDVGLAQIVEQDNLTSAEEEAALATWFYWVPSPGVRYFSYR